MKIRRLNQNDYTSSQNIMKDGKALCFSTLS